MAPARVNELPVVALTLRLFPSVIGALIMLLPPLLLIVTDAAVLDKSQRARARRVDHIAGPAGGAKAEAAEAAAAVQGDRCRAAGQGRAKDDRILGESAGDARTGQSLGDSTRYVPPGPVACRIPTPASIDDPLSRQRANACEQEGVGLPAGVDPIPTDLTRIVDPRGRLKIPSRSGSDRLFRFSTAVPLCELTRKAL